MPLPPSLANCTTLGPNDQIGSGASIVHDLLPPDEAADLFDDILANTPWQNMTHHQSFVPRLVCEQGLFHKGLRPIYRHPSDTKVPQHRMLPSVRRLARATQERLGLDYPFNHALVQLYRSGAEYISEHADKTIDMVEGSVVVNVSLGAQRTMRLRRKAKTEDSEPGPEAGGPGKRDTQRIHLPHNSLFVLDSETNREWLHGIMADKRREEEKSEEERAYGGVRISVTLRFIGSFLSDGKLVGKGSKVSQTTEPAGSSAYQDPSTELLHAFSIENKTTLRSCEIYSGSDVVDLVPDQKVDRNRPIVWVPPIFGNGSNCPTFDNLTEYELAALEDVATVNSPVKIPGSCRSHGTYRLVFRDEEAVGTGQIREYLDSGKLKRREPARDELQMEAMVEKALAGYPIWTGWDEIRTEQTD